MAINIKDLFTYKKEVSLKNREDEEVAKCYIRLLGEGDLNKAFKMARIESTRKRDAYRDHTTEDFKDEIAPISDLSREELTTIILGARKNRFQSQAFVKVDREELPKIEEISQEPDAPELEEQETLDKKIQEQQAQYEKKIEEYVNTRVRETEDQLKDKSDEEILKEAQLEMSNILPLQAFYVALNAYKAYLGSYEDKNCTKRIFSSIEDYDNADALLKNQLVEAYTALELGADDIKN